MNAHKFQYPARCTKIIDGDTIDVTLDLGLRMTSTQRIRLLGVNCPELHATDRDVREAALAAESFTQNVIGDWQKNRPEAFPLLITTAKSDSFGRWLADVESAIYSGDSLNKQLIDNGHAVPFMIAK